MMEEKKPIIPERRRVLCVDFNEDGSIGGIRGLGWKKTRYQAISDININKISYYVEDDDRNEVDVIVAKRKGIEYLTTDPDHSEENNLENLLDCEEYYTQKFADLSAKPF